MSIKIEFSVQRDLNDPILKDFKNGQLSYFSLESQYDSINQDGVGYLSIDDECRMLILSDGMGGHAAGDKSVQILFENLEKFKKYPPKDYATYLREYLHLLIEKTDQDIKAMKIGSGATLVIAFWDKEKAQFVHAGDSPGLLTGSRGKIKYQTGEHSPEGHLLRALGPVKKIDELIKPEDSTLLLNGLGFEKMKTEWSIPTEYASSDHVILFSDGIYHYFDVEKLLDLILKGDFFERNQKVIQQILGEEKSKPYDDTTLALFKFNE